MTDTKMPTPEQLENEAMDALDEVFGEEAQVATQSSDVDNPVIVEFNLQGNMMVAFHTDLGWAEHVHTKVEYQNVEQAKQCLHKYLSELQVLPFQNDAGNQEYANATGAMMRDSLILTHIDESLDAMEDRAFVYLPLLINCATLTLTFTHGIPIHYGPSVNKEVTSETQDYEEKLYKFDFVMGLSEPLAVQFYVPAHQTEDGELKEAGKANSIRGSMRNASVTQFAHWLVTNQPKLVADDMKLLNATNLVVRNTIEKLLMNHLPAVGMDFSTLPFETTVQADGHNAEHFKIYFSVVDMADVPEVPVEEPANLADLNPWEEKKDA